MSPRLFPVSGWAIWFDYKSNGSWSWNLSKCWTYLRSVCVLEPGVWCWRDSDPHCWTGCDSGELSMVLGHSWPQTSDRDALQRHLKTARHALIITLHSSLACRTAARTLSPGKIKLQRTSLHFGQVQYFRTFSCDALPIAPVWTVSFGLQVIPHRQASSSSTPIGSLCDKARL